MITFDVVSLFTKVPLAYTINLILGRLYGEDDNCQDEKNKKKREDWCTTCQNRADLKQQFWRLLQVILTSVSTVNTTSNIMA